MEKEILREMQERIVRGILDVLILVQLRVRPRSAYDVIAFVHKKFHLLMSSGTVYSTIYSLERDGLIHGNFVNRKRRARVYALTDKGEKTIQAFLKVNGNMQLFVTNLLAGPSE